MNARGKIVYSRDPQVVTERILDAAEAVFMEEGFAGASTDRILGSFGGSKATLYRHFPTKNDMLVGVIRRIGERLVTSSRWDEIVETEPRTWLIAFGERSLRMILRDDAIFVGRMVVAQGRNFPILRETFSAVTVEPMLGLLCDRLREWAKGALILCPEPEADSILYYDLLMSGWISRSMFGNPPQASEAFLQREAGRAASLFLDGRRPRP